MREREAGRRFQNSSRCGNLLVRLVTTGFVSLSSAGPYQEHGVWHRNLGKRMNLKEGSNWGESTMCNLNVPSGWLSATGEEDQDMPMLRIYPDCLSFSLTLCLISCLIHSFHRHLLTISCKLSPLIGTGDERKPSLFLKSLHSTGETGRSVGTEDKAWKA